jgi:O-antigen/teichoic acid export membrane protein
MSSRLSRNLIAGFTSSVWTAVIGLLVVPFYLKYLGLEAYGLVGFFTTMQAVFQLLDLGIGPTINREVARSSVSGEVEAARDLLHTLATVYWIIGILLGAIAVMAGPFLSKHWLNAERLPQATVEHALVLMGVIIAIRWPLGLYLGALVGAQRLTVSSGISIAMVTVTNVGAVAVLAFLSPTIEAFFLWQGFSALIQVLWLRAAAWRALHAKAPSRFDVRRLAPIWRFSAGMGLVAVLGLVLTNLDKVVLSKFVSLEDLARYNLAGLASRSLYLFLTPVFSAVFPRFSAMVAAEDTSKIADMYKTGTRLLLAVVFPVAAYVGLFSQEIFLVWTRNPDVANHIQPVAAFLLLGTAMNGAMHFPYAIQLAYGHSRLPVVINSILILAFVPLLIVWSKAYGIVGGGAAWAALNVMYLALGTWLTHRVILKGIAWRWLLQDVGIPLLSTLLFVIVALFLMPHLAANVFSKLAVGALLAVSACFFVLLLSPGALRRLRGLFFAFATPSTALGSTSTGI